MPTAKLIGEVDQNHRLVATVPDSIEPGKVEVIVIAPPREPDRVDDDWMAGIAHEWEEDLADRLQRHR